MTASLSKTHQARLRALLAEIMTARQESLTAFGATLAATIDASRQPYSRQYVHRLRSGADAITPEIAGALHVLAAMLDGASELQARAREYTVLATHDLPPGTVVLGHAQSCALAGCRVHYVAASPRQRYCSTECRKEAKRRKRHH